MEKEEIKIIIEAGLIYSKLKKEGKSTQEIINETNNKIRPLLEEKDFNKDLLVQMYVMDIALFDESEKSLTKALLLQSNRNTLKALLQIGGLLYKLKN